MARPENLYEELARFSSEESLDKTASIKDAAQIEKELDDIGYSTEKLETLANEIFGFCKSAEEVVNGEEPKVEEAQEPEATTPEDKVKEDAVEAVDAKVEELANAVETLKALDGGNEDAAELESAVKEVQAAFAELGLIKLAEEDGEGTEKVEEPKEVPENVSADEALDTVEEKVTELAEAVDQYKESAGVDTEKAENAVIEAAAAFMDYKMAKVAAYADWILENADDNLKDAIVTDAYCKVAEVFKENGIGLAEHIASQIGEENADEMAETISKLAAISGKNEFEVADDVIANILDKVAYCK